MKVFISWSGPISRQVADALNEWLPYVLQEVKPFLSTEGIQKGAPWFEVIGEQLKETSFGILCLTPYNLEAPWILFEAGALSKQVTDKTRVIPLVLGLSLSELKPPLSNFNAATCDREEVLKLLRSLNDGLNEKALDIAKLDRVFDKWWPDLDAKIKQAKDALVSAKAEMQTGATPKRSTEDMFGELLELTRSTAQRQDATEHAVITLRDGLLALTGGILDLIKPRVSPHLLESMKRNERASVAPRRDANASAAAKMAPSELSKNPKETDDGSSSST